MRRANKLWRRLGARSARAGTAAAAYERLFEKTLQAELRATEAGTARIQWLAARIGNRPQFTL